MGCQGRQLVFIICSWISLLSGAVLFTGCGKAKWNSFPVPIYADASVLNAKGADADLHDAMSYWEAQIGKKVFDFKGTWNGQYPPYSGSAEKPDSIAGNVIFAPNHWQFGPDIAGETDIISGNGKIDSAMVMMNYDLPMCAGDCTEQGDAGKTSRRKAMTHELGHFLGLDHVQETNNIMYPTIQTGGSLAGVQADKVTLKDLVN